MEEKLTSQQQSVVDAFIDPDQQKQAAKFIWSEDFQRVVLGMLLCERFFLVQSLDLIQPNYFLNEIHETVCKFVLEHFAKYNQQPSKIWLREQISEHLKKRHRDGETAEAMRLLYVGELNTVYDYHTKGGIGDLMPGLDSTEAILDKVTAFAKTQAMKMAFWQCQQLIRRNPESDETWTKVGQITKEASLVGRKLDLGLEYFGTIDERYDRLSKQEEEKDVFTSGFRKIDEGFNFGGLHIGELGAWMGTPGTGKSLCLVKAAVKNVFHRNKKVLYISTEMDQDLIATRFDSMIAKIGQHQLIARRQDVKVAINDQLNDFIDRKRLYIKQFPSGTADINTIKAFYAQLVMYGFKPDLMVVDYPGDLKDMPGMDGWESRWKTLRDLRGFGAEEKHCTMIAIQPNRSASKLTLDELMDESMQGESFYQNKVLDAFWTITQTKDEKAASVARVYVAKARNGKSRYDFKMEFDYEQQTLDMWEVSEERYRTRMGKVVSKGVDKTSSRLETKQVDPTEGIVKSADEQLEQLEIESKESRKGSWTPDHSEH